MDLISNLRRIVSRAMASPMLRHVAILAGGQSFASAIPILTAPVLGRLYTPADYGILGAYMSLAVVIAALGNWQYAQAIVLERSDRRAYALVRVCLWTSLLTAAGAVFVPLLASLLLKDTSKLAALSLWLWLIPVSALLGGLSGALTSLANRFRRYSSMASIQMAAALATALVSIALGWHGWGADGLLTGYFAGQFTTFLGYVLLVGKSAARAVSETSPRNSRALLKRHRAYALYTTPTTFIEQVAANAPIYALGAIGAPAAIGLYSRARLLLAMPLTLIGGAVAQVFQQRAAADVARQGHCREVYAKTFLTLAGLGLIPTLVLTLLAPTLFALYLGPKWRESGEVARILAPMMLLNVICSPLARVFYLRHRQRLDFLLSLGNAALVTLFTAAAVLLGASASQIIGSYATAASIVYVVYLVIGWRLSQPPAAGRPG